MWLVLENKSVYSCYSHGCWPSVTEALKQYSQSYSSLQRKLVWRTAYNTKPHSSSVISKKIISTCMLRLCLPWGCLGEDTAGCLILPELPPQAQCKNTTGNHRQPANDFLTKTTVSLGKMSPHVWWFCCCLICSVLVCVSLWMQVQLKARCLGSAGAGVTSGCLKWALGTELGSSARIVHALKHWAIFPFLTSWYWFLLRAQVWTTSKVLRFSIPQMNKHCIRISTYRGLVRQQ